jgi:hypothetical protein
MRMTPRLGLRRWAPAGAALVSVALCLAGLAGVRPVWAGTPAPGDVVAAAQSGLPALVQALPADELANYGFANAAEAAQATLGEPYQLYVLTAAALQAYTGSQRLSDLTTPVDQWYFPVLVNGDPRTMLIVAKLEGRWQAVAIGGTALPKNLALARQALAGSGAGAQAAALAAAGATVRYVQVRQASADLLLVSGADADYLMPVMAHPEALGVQNLELYAAADLAGQLRDRVATNIQREQDAVNNTFGGGAPAGPAELRTALNQPAAPPPAASAPTPAPQRSAPSPTTYAIGVLGLLVIGGLALARYKVGQGDRG